MCSNFKFSHFLSFSSFKCFEFLLNSTNMYCIATLHQLSTVCDRSMDFIFVC